MTDRELLESISDSDRKKLLNRWWDIAFLVLGILGAVFCLMVIMVMTPEDRSSGDVILAVILFFVVPPVILLLIGLRKKIFWSKEKQDAYILKRLAKQAFNGNQSTVIEVTSTNDAVTEELPEEAPMQEATEVSADSEPLSAPVIKQEEPEEVAIEEPKLETTAEEEEDQEIILFPEI